MRFSTAVLPLSAVTVARANTPELQDAIAAIRALPQEFVHNRHLSQTLQDCTTKTTQLEKCGCESNNLAATFNGGSCDALRQLFPDDPANSALSRTEAQTLTQGICESASPCLTSLKTSMDSVIATCFVGAPDLSNGIGQLTELAYRKLNAALDLACTKVGTEYCAPKVLYGAKDLAADVNPTTLSEFCTGCVPRLLEKYSGYEPRAATVLSNVAGLLCTKDQDKWCAVEFEEFKAIQVADTAARVTKACSTRCIPKWIARSWVWGTADPTAGFKALCSANEKGDLCIPAILDVQSSGALDNKCGLLTCDQLGAPAGTCVAAVTPIAQDLGCCVGNWLEYPVHGIIATNTYNLCKLTKPASCPGFGIHLKRRLHISNLAWAWFEQQAQVLKDAVIAAIQKDLAAHLGLVNQKVEEILNRLDTVKIKIEVIKGDIQTAIGGRRLLQAAESTTFLVDVQCDDGDCDKMYADLISNDLLLLTLNTNLPLTAQIDPSSPLIAAPGGGEGVVKPSTGQISRAPLRAPMTFAAAAFAALALAF